MLTIWIKILLATLGVLFGIAGIIASWIIFTALDGVYHFFPHKGDDLEC